MYSLKRSSNCNEALSVGTKKLRTTFDKENMPIICFEDLSNEIFFEIFEYLDGYDIYKAFSNLNFRFQRLITCSPLPLKIKFHSNAKSEVENNCKDVIIPNRHRILSLYFENELIINDFFTHCIIDSSFDRLESIVLEEVSSDWLMILLFHLKSLPRLFLLTIHIDNEWGCDLSNIYRLIFSLPSLKYNQLSLPSNDDDEDLNISVILANNERFSTIQYLNINHNCTFDELFSILQHTPRLRHLFCENLIRSDTDIDFKKLVTLSNLTYLCINNCQVEFDEFEIFITKLSTQLQVLNVKQYWCEGYLDVDQWERLIKKHLPHLRRFYYMLYRFFDPDYEDILSDTEINRFTSAFWIKRQWFFEIKVDGVVVIYSIQPFRKSWFDSHEPVRSVTCFEENNRQDTLNSSNQIVPTIQLSIDIISSEEQNHSFIDKFRPIFVAIQFTRLNINCKKVSIGTLVKIIQLLPKLDLLEVSSLPIIGSNLLFDHDGDMLFLTSINNKITKVNLEEMIELEQVNFVLYLCLCIRYFQGNVPENMDLEILVRFILRKASAYIPQLKSLYLCIPNANEAIVNQLQKLIDTEKLLANYMIKRTGNDILLKWN